MVKSKSASLLTKTEQKVLIEKTDKMNKTQLKKFRNEFNPDEMGFAERKEGI